MTSAPSLSPAASVSPSAALEALHWRYATKKFDPSLRIAPDVWNALEQSLVLAPSSFGLQPWRFVVVGDPDVRAKLRAASWNQPQITTASHLVVLARRSPMRREDVRAFIARMSEVRGIPAEQLAGYQGMIEQFVFAPGFDAEAWTARQCYIALGTLLTTAAFLGVDACPMEGIDPAAYDELLGLPASGFRTTVVATLGYRAADDSNAGARKVRYPTASVVVHR
jgi:nitroreductase